LLYVAFEDAGEVLHGGTGQRGADGGHDLTEIGRSCVAVHHAGA
jgi:hypothetical protein